MWTVVYHQEVEHDLKILGSVNAKKILKAIDERIINGHPHEIGKPLSGSLTGCRRIRVGNTRIVYKVNNEEIEIFIIAVGIRRDEMVYKLARKRTIIRS